MPDPVTPENCVIGVDVGGTKVAAGFVDPQGEIHQHTRVAMNSHGTAAEGFAGVTAAIDALLKMAPELRGAVQRIGICAPGPLDPHTGVVLNPPNVPCWRNFPLAAEVSRRYGGPVKVENDAKSAGLAETLWGAGRGYRHVFYTCIGTGIGAGILIDGRIYHGRTGAAAEGGHVTIDYHGARCGCGKRGCICLQVSRGRTKISRWPLRQSGTACRNSVANGLPPAHSAGTGCRPSSRTRRRTACSAGWSRQASTNGATLVASGRCARISNWLRSE